MSDFKCGSRGSCICGQLDYGGHEHCTEAWALLNTGGYVWTLTSKADPSWHCWTILGVDPEQCFMKCVQDFPGRTIEQWRSSLSPVVVKIKDIPEEYRPTLPWRKPWLGPKS